MKRLKKALALVLALAAIICMLFMPALRRSQIRME